MRYLLAIGGLLLGALAIAALWLFLPRGEVSPDTTTAVTAQQAAAPIEAEGDSEGSLRVCNQTSNSISIALGYRAERGWQSEGWWVAPPNECKDIYSGDLEARRYYYLYAADDVGGGSWDGSVFMCTRDESFTIFGVEDCLARGYERTGFFEIDTRNRSNWTLQLTDNQGPGAEPVGTDDIPLEGEELDGTLEDLPPDDIDPDGEGATQ